MDNTLYKYKDAVLPRTYTICGVELKPFSFGHFLLLEHINSPFIETEEREISFVEGLEHFFLALIICALPFEKAAKVLDDKEEMQRLRDGFEDHVRKNMELDKNWNIYSKIRLFKKYMDYFINSMPVFTIEKASKAPASGSDWKNNLFIIFLKFGYKELEILNMNWRKMFYQWTANSESNGEISVTPRQMVESKPTMIIRENKT